MSDTPEWTEPESEIEFVAERLLRKVFQGNSDKIGLARHCASVAIAATNDYVPPYQEPVRPPLPPGFTPSQTTTAGSE